MEGVFVFLMPVFIVLIVSHYRFRTRELALREKQGGDPKLLEAGERERRELRQRVEHLETIISSVDFELNQRMNKLLAAQSVVAPPPVASAPSIGRAATRPSDPPPPGLLSPGQVVLGRYTIERPLGSGGMGAVYLARDAKLGEHIALKTILAGVGADARVLAERFLREVQAARRVTHENVVRIHDLGEDGPLLFLSMEYVDGETLWSRLKRIQRLPMVEALAVLDAIAAGVAAAHAAGVVHRDLKPQNVLLAGTGVPPTVKVIDFGLAKVSHLAGMTTTGMILGTPDYMAPEQIRGQEADVRADVYALGATAYAALAGRPPFEAASPVAIGFAVLHDPITPIEELRPEVPAALAAAIGRALSKDPAARFADAGAFRAAAFGNAARAA